MDQRMADANAQAADAMAAAQQQMGGAGGMPGMDTAGMGGSSATSERVCPPPLSKCH